MKLGGKERKITYHYAVPADLNNRRTRSVLSHLGIIALVGFLDAGILEEEEGAGLTFGAVELPDIFGNKTTVIVSD